MDNVEKWHIAMKLFQQIACDKNYHEKVGGDYAYRNKKGKVIRLISCKKEQLKIFEQGKGYCFFPLCHRQGEKNKGGKNESTDNQYKQGELGKRS